MNGKGLFWLIFILILVFLLLNYGGVTQDLVQTSGQQFQGIVGTLQGQGARAGTPRVNTRNT
jgi:hypothetical protein